MWTYLGAINRPTLGQVVELNISFQFSSLQSLSRVRLFATPWITARQASLSITNSWSSLTLTSIESVMPSSYLILCRSLLLVPPIPPSIRVFSNESTLRMRCPKYWSLSFSIIPSKEIPGLISFRMDWLDLLAVRNHIYTIYTILVRVWKGPSGQRSYFNGLIKLLQLRLQLCFSKRHKEHSKIFTTIMSWSENDEWLLFFSLCAQSLSHGQLFVTPWTVACQATLLMKFSGQEYWSELLLPSLLFLKNIFK